MVTLDASGFALRCIQGYRVICQVNLTFRPHEDKAYLTKSGFMVFGFAPTGPNVRDRFDGKRILLASSMLTCIRNWIFCFSSLSKDERLWIATSILNLVVNNCPQSGKFVDRH